MDTRTLQQFLYLADTLHFGRASQLAHISPSALSRSIKQLEETLGTNLFIRDNRSVLLTHEGSLLQTYAREAISQWELIRETLLQESQALHGEISMYCSVTASYSFLYAILKGFRDHYPGIEIKLHTGDPEHALKRVQQGEEDIAMAARPDRIPAGLAFEPVGVSPLRFIRPKHPGDPLAALCEAAPPDSWHWNEIPMILAEEGVSRDRVNQWFKQQNAQPRIYAQTAGHEAIVSMVSLGFGVGVVPKIVLDNSPLASNVQELDGLAPLDTYEVGLFTQQRKLKNPIIKAFWTQANSLSASGKG